MNNDDNHESIATIAARRCTAPGVIDREPVLRRYDRLQHPLPASSLTDRLQQRAARTERADGNTLVWQRTSIGTIASNEPVPEPPPSADVGHATTPSMQEPPPPSTDVGHATTPSVQQPPPVQRSASAAPVGTTARATVVQRLVQGHRSPGTLASESPAVPVRKGMEQAAPAVVVGREGVSAPVTVMRKTDLTISRRAQQTPLATIVDRPSNPMHADVAALPSATRTASLPIRIARKEQAAAAARGSSISLPSAAPGTVATTHPAPAIALAPGSPSATTPLVLRRAAAQVAVSPSTPPGPYSMPASSAVAEELTRAAQTEQPVVASAPHVTSGAHGGNADVDQLAAEVERRLRVRLEIERERRGIRSWR